MRSRRLLGAVGAIAMLLAACNGTGAPTTDSATGDPATASAAPSDGASDQAVAAGGGQLLAAAASESSGRSVRFTIESVVETPDGDVATVGEGVTSADGLTSAVTLRITGAALAAAGQDDVEAEIRFVDGLVYQRFPGLLEQLGEDAEWFSVDPNAVVPGFEDVVEQAQENDPTKQLELLQEIADVEEVGPEDVNGVATTHYRGTTTVGAMVEAGGVELDALGDGAAGIDLDAPAAFDIWVDGDGLVRRMVQGFAVDGSDSTTTIDFLEYDVPVEVEAPPADDTVDLGALFAELHGGANGG